ncbi:flagellar protein FliS [Enterococcus faecium]|nr:flagellar protein FliS [Enterococcus faecium]
MDGNNASKDKEVELTERGFLYLAKSTPRILLFAVKLLYRIVIGTINLVRQRRFREAIKSLTSVPIIFFKLLYNARTRSINFVEKMQGKQKENKQENQKNGAVQNESQTQSQDLKGKKPEITVSRNNINRELGSSMQNSGGTKAEGVELLRSNKAARAQVQNRKRSLSEITASATKTANKWNERVLNERRISPPSRSR